MELIAGPWVGEFGHELFHWQGYLRTAAKHFDRVICIGRTGHDALYKDFCSQYINYDPVGEPDMYFLPTHDNEFKITLLESFRSGERDPKKTDLFWLKPNFFNETNRTLGFISDVDPTYIVYGTPLDVKDPYVVFHARNRPQLGPAAGMNWSYENWVALAKAWSTKYKIFSIGTKKSSYYIEGTVDSLDIPLDKTVTLLRNAKAIIGSSSGPMHLASLCDCPQVVWSPQSKNRKNYETIKNPFKVRVNYFDEMGGFPSVDLVSKKMMEIGL